MTWQEYGKYLLQYILKEEYDNETEKKNSPAMPLSGTWFGLFPFALRMFFSK